MSIITVQCRLQAKEETLQVLWTMMMDRNTALINQILETIKTHSRLSDWLQQGYIPFEWIKRIVDGLKFLPKFQGMPGRFYDSSKRLVDEIYKSWFAIQKKERRILYGKKSWLAMSTVPRPKRTGYC